MSAIVWGMFMHSIKKRLLVSLLTVIVLSTFVSTVITYFELKKEMDELFDYNMEQMAHAIAVHTTNGQENFINNNKDAGTSLRGEEEFLIQVWHGDRISFSSKPAIQLPDQKTDGASTMMYEGEKWRYYGLNADNGWFVQVSQSIPIRHTVIWEIYFEQLIPTLIQLPVLMGLVWIVVGFGFAPLSRISESIEKRSALFLEKLPEQNISTEVLTMVRAINGLLDRLSRTLDTQRQFTADAAHELRTPLTAVRLELDVLKRAETEEEKQHSLEKLYKAVDRSARLVHQLLEMARLEPEQTSEQTSDVSLYKIAGNVADEMQQFAQSKNITVRLDGSDNITLRGRPHALTVLVSNLVRNAIQYTPQDGKIVISISEKNGEASLSVSDNGHGIPEKERERIFDRFYRVPDRQHTGVVGSGLGLAIVKSIADSHNATIDINDGLDGVDGKGACVKICFPKET